MKHLLTAHHLHKTYRESGKLVTALQDVSLQIQAGECLGVVGESGSGKSTLARILLALEQPDSGEVYMDGLPLHQLKGEALREERKHIQVVLQDPNSSFNPRLPLWRSVIEPLDNYKDVVPPFLADVRHSRRESAARLLEMVGLQVELMDRYPHELSGGQKQRAAIARGISLLPRLLICDEPTSSLDVSIQAQILQLLKQLKATIGMSYLFISHDIAAVLTVSDRIIVMKNGQVLDQFNSLEIMSQERHPYTKQLVAVVS